MELGIVQTKWLADMRANPERQVKGTLGGVDSNGKIGMCCLGQLVVTTNTIKDPSYQIPSVIFDKIGCNMSSKANLEYNWRKYGLHGENGQFLNENYTYEENDKTYTLTALTEMNDRGISWLIIADFIEQNPENVFSESK